MMSLWISGLSSTNRMRRVGECKQDSVMDGIMASFRYRFSANAVYQRERWK